MELAEITGIPNECNIKGEKVSAYHDHIFELFSANGSSDSQTLESYNVQSCFWNQKILIGQKDFPS